jgi:hypothetical protein
MSDSLTTLISKVQALLGDDGTIFTTATITAAAREALSIYNEHLPVFAGTLITGVTDQYEYELSDEDTRAVDILDVLLQGDNSNELDISVTYDSYNEDERVWFRLRSPVTSSDTLIARYTIPQTINGLDAEVESTIPARLDPLLVKGIAGEALRSRAYARVEKINLNKAVSENYKELALAYNAEFLQVLVSLANKRMSAVGEPDTRTWAA